MNYLDLEELMVAVLGLTDDQANDDPDYDQLMFDKFEVSSDQFDVIASCLMSFTMVSKPPLTKKLYQGFVHVEQSMFICKKEYKTANK